MANFTSFSPAGPMQATFAILSATFSFKRVWVSNAPSPHRSLASLSSPLPLLIDKKVGFAAYPVMTIPSYPVILSCAPNSPPQFDSPHNPVRGDLEHTTHRPDVGAVVPVIGPVIIRRMFAAPRGSVSFPTLSIKYRQA
ncbi:MAG: hypothetical protein RBG13Loki_3358 [Promethearchaeota archaeon CR_4]|nr:MAG: hypothetical protein RBG13Loki_3358 [Candidatus Lokiarchaeota archaeon CR_4]